MSKKNSLLRVKLSEKGLWLQKESNGHTKTDTISLEDIVGCRCMRSKRFDSAKCGWHPGPRRRNQSKVVDENSTEQRDETDTSAFLYIYAYVLKKSKVKMTKRRERMVLTLRFYSYDRYEDNIREAQKWKVTIKFLLQVNLRGPNLPSCYFRSSDNIIDNKILVLLNPKSGVGKSRDVFQNKVVPILTEADINYDLHVTRFSNDARNVMRTQNLWQYTGGIVVVGGDGILFEAINGLMERPDWQPLLENLRFGIIPCGSGNGLAKSISYASCEPHDNSPVLISTLNIVRGLSSPMDLVRVETKNLVLFSFLSIGWGLLADIDIESERLRSIGSQRFTIWSIARLIGLRTYKGTVSYLPASNDKLHRRSSGASEFLLICLQDEDRRDSFYSVCSRKSTYHSAAGSSYESLTEETSRTFGPPSNFPPLTQPVPSNWQVISGEFVLVQAAYQSHLATDVFFAPSAKLDDGFMWLMIVRAGISRAHLLQFLLGLSNGTHVSIPRAEMVTVAAFRIEPEANSGHMTVDGELIELGPIQGQVIPSAARVFARPQ
ncbi:hypothetical protein AAG570_013927 [Ranatra chinensis]|uniref:DAGKc domain-containing protein n=1 Tax=Ranatra chinensis TaxID=642074 RepID=A0ABD0YDM4_9HEMI